MVPVCLDLDPDLGILSQKTLIKSDSDGIDTVVRRYDVLRFAAHCHITL